MIDRASQRGFLLNPYRFGSTPLPPVISGLTLWVNGTSPALLYQSSGGSLVSADNQSVQVAQSGGSVARCSFSNESGKVPLYRTGIVNGQSVIRYDGSNDFSTIYTTSAPGTIGTPVTLADLITASAYTLICAVNVSSAVAAQPNIYQGDAIWSDGGAFAGLHVSQSGGTLTYHAYNWDGSADYATVTSAAATWVVLSVRHDSGNIRIRINGGSWNSTASGNTTTLTNSLRFGTNSGQTQFLPFDIAHAAFYNVALLDADVASVESYFAAQLGI